MPSDLALLLISPLILAGIMELCAVVPVLIHAAWEWVAGRQGDNWRGGY